MRLKFLCTAVAAIIICFFTSCQKEMSLEDNDPSGTPNPPSNVSNQVKPKTMTEVLTLAGDTLSNTTFNLVYDTQSRLTLMQSASSPGDRFEYAYYASRFSMKLFNANVESVYAEYYFSGSDRIDSSMQYNEDKDTTTEKYGYNAAGQLASITEYEYSTSGGSVQTDKTTLTYDSKGNITKEQSSQGTFTYTYYDDLKTPFNIWGPYQKATPNLVKTATQNGVVVNYKYTFDSIGRLILMEQRSDTQAIVMFTKYTY